jgi:hypothetical protein
MPLSRRTTTSLIGYPSFGSKGTPACSGQFVFSNSPTQTGSNQFSYLICENNTQGSLYGGELSTGYLCLNLNNSYYQQVWKIKNDIIAVGENFDGTHVEYFNSEINSFVFSEANANFEVIDSNINIKNKSQPDFDTKIYVTESGIKYEFIDSNSTKMKWTSRIEIIQNIGTGIPTPFLFSDVQDQVLNGSLPVNAVFDQASNNAVLIDGSEDDGSLADANTIDSGTDQN